METVSIATAAVLTAACATLGLGVSVGTLALVWALGSRLERQIGEMGKALSQLAASKRFSTYLEIERKGGISLSTEQFEANKPVLEAAMLTELEEQFKRNNLPPSTAAYQIMNRSGADAFIDYEIDKKVKEALTRLIANTDRNGARQFIRDFVAAL